MLNHIYFGFKPDGIQRVSTDVKAYGLNLCKAPPCNVNTLSFIRKAQPGYDSYVRHLPAFVEAFQKDKIIDRLGGFHEISRVENIIPLPFPPILFKYEHRISQQVLDLLEKIDAKMVENAREKCYEIQNYKIEDIKALLATNPDEKTPVTLGKINLIAFKQMILISKIISILLTIHSYPAFVTEDDAAEQYIPNVIEPRGALTVRDKGKKRRQDGEVIIGEEVKDDSEEELEDAPADLSNPIHLNKARPPPENKYPWGKPANLRSFPGLFFAFAKPLCILDKVTIPSFIDKYFLQGLGSNEDRSIFVANEIRSACAKLASTTYGHIMAHIVKCFDIALQAQCILYPMFVNDTYIGCAVQGFNFAVAVDRVKYEAISPEELKAAVELHNPLVIALEKILAITGVDVTKVKSMRQLSNALQNVRLTLSERDEILALASQITFGEVYYRANPTTVSNLISAIAKEDYEIPDLMPMHPSCIFEREKIPLLLSAFGLLAPTFELPGKEYIDMKTAKCPPNFVFGYATIAKATQDWKSVIRTGIIHNNPTNLSKNDLYRALHGTSKDDIWAALKSLSHAPVEPEAPAEKANEMGSIFDL